MTSATIKYIHVVYTYSIMITIRQEYYDNKYADMDSVLLSDCVDEEYSDLVAKYKKSQAAMKVGGPSNKALMPKPKSTSTPFFAVSYFY